MLRDAIGKLTAGQSLGQDEAAGAMETIMSGAATPAQIGAFITALRMKGETVEEIAGLALVMRAKATPVQTRRPVVDTCGTGGDVAGTINISTAAAFVAAGAGLTVAKHGNRAVTSRCGSADVLETLGVAIALESAAVGRCLDEVGIGFMFAPIYHPAMKHAAGPRRELGIRTVFNLLGPLTNPAGATAQVLGVSSPDLVEKLARVLLSLGCQHALVVHGEDGVDELSISGPSRVAEVRHGEIASYTVSPEECGLARASRDELFGGDAAENAARIRAIFAGGDRGGARNVVLLNAAAALVAGDLAANLSRGVQLATAALDDGRALDKLNRLIDLSTRERAASAA